MNKSPRCGGVIVHKYKMDSAVENDRKPTGETAATHPNYTAVTQASNQLPLSDCHFARFPVSLRAMLNRLNF